MMSTTATMAGERRWADAAVGMAAVSTASAAPKANLFIKMPFLR